MIITFLTIILFADNFNRVVLKKLPEEEYSDYINSSYVDVNKQTNRENKTNKITNKWRDKANKQTDKLQINELINTHYFSVL